MKWVFEWANYNSLSLSLSLFPPFVFVFLSMRGAQMLHSKMTAAISNMCYEQAWLYQASPHITKWFFHVLSVSIPTTRFQAPEMWSIVYGCKAWASKPRKLEVAIGIILIVPAPITSFHLTKRNLSQFFIISPLEFPMDFKAGFVMAFLFHQAHGAWQIHQATTALWEEDKRSNRDETAWRGLNSFLHVLLLRLACFADCWIFFDFKDV